MLLSANYRKAKHYLKDKNILSSPSSRVDSVAFWVLIWNLCASLGLSFLLPRQRRSIPCSQDNVLIRRKREEKPVPQTFCFGWRKIIPSSLLGRRRISLADLNANHCQSDLESQWLAMAAMIHPQRQKHYHWKETGFAGRGEGLWWNFPIESTMKGIHLGSLCHSLCWVPVDFFNSCLSPRVQDCGNHVCSLCSCLNPVEFEIDVFSANFISQRSHPAILTFLPSLALFVFCLLLVGTVLDAVFANSPLDSDIGGRHEALRSSTWLSPRGIVHELPSPTASQEKGTSQLLPTMTHPSQKTVGISHVASEKTIEQKTLSFL